MGIEDESIINVSNISFSYEADLDHKTPIYTNKEYSFSFEVEAESDTVVCPNCNCTNELLITEFVMLLEDNQYCKNCGFLL